MEDVAGADCIISAVAHDEFKNLGLDNVKRFFKDVPEYESVLIDVKGIFRVEDLKATDIKWWRL